MLPGMNPRQMRQAMQRLGIQQEEIDALEVIIRCEDRDIIIASPSVTKVNMAGQKSYQITGEEMIQERESEPEINDEDLETVISQTGVSREKAEEAIREADYDLAQAIMNLKSD